MDNNTLHQQRWHKCLALIRQQIPDLHIFDVWFRDIVLVSYDEEARLVTLGVPSRYVYEYIEEVQFERFDHAFTAAFGPDVNLKYAVLAPAAPAATPLSGGSPSASSAPGGSAAGSPAAIPSHGRIHIAIPDAKKRLEAELHKHLGDGMVWLDAYDEVAEWLTDNHGRGLLCIGHAGLGKSLLCRTVLPAIIGGTWAVCSAVEMTLREGYTDRIDTLLKERMVVIDGLGTEPVHIKKGQRRPFFDLCEAAEQDGKLLLIATGLSTSPTPGYSGSILNLYGRDVLDRLRTTTALIELKGEGMRPRKDQA